MRREELDPYAILQSLGLGSVTSITPVLGGFDTAIWRVESAGASYALRVFHRGENDSCHQERQVMELVAQAGLPVPRVYAEGMWQEHPALLLSWIPGQTVAAALRAKPWRVWKLGVMCGAMHAMIHAVPAPALLSQQPEEWIDWAALEDQSLRARLVAAEKPRSVLLHMDYHPLNIMVDGDTITGVLDWKIALAGDPRADAARTISLLQVATFEKVNMMEVIVRRLFVAGWRAGYQRQGGSLTEMSLFYAWAGAVMIRDLGQRVPPERLPGIHRWAEFWRRRAERERARTR